MSGVESSIVGRTDPSATLAVAGDLLASCVHGRVTIFSGLTVGNLVPYASWESGATRQLGLAPSGHFLLERSTGGDAIEVRRTDSGASVVRVQAESGRPWVVGAIVSTQNEELLVASVEPRLLQVHRLDSGEILRHDLVRQPSGFTYAHLVPMTDGDTVAAVGHYPGEGKESLVFLSLRRLLTEPGYLAQATHRSRAVDDAYQLAAGPCGSAAAVVYRDPEDGEDPEDDEPDDPNRIDVYGMRGLYVRRLSDLAVVQEVPVDIPVPTGTTLAGTPEHLVAALDSGALVVPRSGAPAIVENATTVAMDPRSGWVVLATASGDLRLLAIS
jgi:hypothetical protein